MSTITSSCLNEQVKLHVTTKVHCIVEFSLLEYESGLFENPLYLCNRSLSVALFYGSMMPKEITEV